MKRKPLVLLLLALTALAPPGFAQTGPVPRSSVTYVLLAPSGSCVASAHIQAVIGSGAVYSCQTGTWGQVSGGGGSYTLPTATSNILGGVKPDGTSILNTAGVISVTAASAGALGLHAKADTAGAADTAANVSGTPTLPSGTILLSPPNTQTSSYVLAATDCGALVRMNLTGTANTTTVPPNASVALPVGCAVTVRQAGTGVTTIVAGSGVTITTPSSLILRARYSSVQLVKVTTDAWDLMGDTQ